MAEIWGPLHIENTVSTEGKDGISRASIEIFPSPTIGERVIRTLGGTGVKVNVASSPSLGIDSTINLSRQLVVNGFSVVPHIGAQEVHDKTHLANIAEQITDLGINEVFVVKGDGQTKGKYRTAMQLMQDFAHTNLRLGAIGIAGYPEGVEGMTEEQLLNAIRARERLANNMGAELKIVTQMCFDNEKILLYANNLKRNNIEAPVIVGLPISENIRRLHEMAVRCRVGESKNTLLLEDLDSEYSSEGLVGELLEGDEEGLVSGFHIYTFNKILKTKGLLF